MPPLLRFRASCPFPFLQILSSPNPNPNPHPKFNFSAHFSQSSIQFPLNCSQLPIPNPNSTPRRIMTLSTTISASKTEPMTIPDTNGAKAKDFGGPDDQDLVVVSFYKFADFPDHANLRKPLKELCEELRVSGGIILAPEGINGSICGTRDSVEKVLKFIQSDNRLDGLRKIESPVSPEEEALHHGHSSSSPLAAGEDGPFRWDHVRVKLKKEIVTLGMPSVSPIERVGKYVSPRDWNALITDPDTVVIDVRNDYETRIGKFRGAVDPCTTAFREFPYWVEDEFQLPKDGEHSKTEEDGSNANAIQHTGSPRHKMPQRVAMYCTGGIRCEKASSFLLSKGFKEVYHLKGGILKYLEEIPKSESLWEGECFVFDKRVSVEHGLTQGTFKLCYGCKQPISDADMEVPEFEYGVCCPYCYNTKTEEEKERARARQRQFEAWGIIGGPDKGRQPTSKSDDKKSNISQHSSSI